MLRRPLVVFAVLSCLVSPAVWAAEVAVLPGTGTLAATVASASAGDTLVLQAGTFTGDVQVNKSLTLRAASRDIFASLIGGLTINGDGIRVTVQGLRFSQYLTVNRAGAVRILENEWAAGGINAVGPVGLGQGDADGTPALVIVGNRLASGSVTEENGSGSAAIYIAGNSIAAGGCIYTKSPAWIIGNGSPLVFSSGGIARIIANRLHCTNSCNYCGQNTMYGAIYVTASYSIISENLIELAALQNFPSQNGISATGGYTVITNNVIRGISPQGVRWSGAAIYSLSSSQVSGNIVIDFPTADGIFSISGNARYNLCYQTNVSCPSGNGNLNADPKFIDLVDYRLAPDSPAINAGPTDYWLADLDRTRNDMGIHGGPWSIDQYDAQRDPNNLRPYVYPLTTIGWPRGNGVSGSVDVQALGIARLR